VGSDPDAAVAGFDVVLKKSNQALETGAVQAGIGLIEGPVGGAG
jgi:hypothetical protein